MNLTNCIKLSLLLSLFLINVSSEAQKKCKQDNLQSLNERIQTPTFSIDFQKNVFLKDNQTFQYISGSILYSRIPEIYWYDRLLKMKAAGLNTIQFYVPWNFHEYEDGKYNFAGNRDLDKFLTLARSLNLLVLLRSGPYICGEWDFGGLPAWLLRKNPEMNLRSSSSDYLSYVVRWYSVLMPILKPHLYKNNGSIIMVQVENEYGYYTTCDNNYLKTLYDTVQSYLGKDVIIYSTDGNNWNALACGSSDRRIFSTVDFGPSGAYNPSSAFGSLKSWQPNGPLVNSEYYSGWLDSWGSSHHTTSTSDVMGGLSALYSYSNSVNVNMYMFHGGTNFEFWNGANNPSYAPQVTSYDYDAPISEAGDTNDKYIAIRNYIKTINPKQPLPPIPPNTTKVAYGSFVMQQMVNYLPNLLNTNASTFQYPETMESLSQYQGYMVYLTSTAHLVSTQIIGESDQLAFSRIGDTAYVFTSNSNHTDIKYQGTLDRNMNSLSLSIELDDNVFVLMENAGHINFGGSMYNDVKGIIGNVTLNGNILTNWKHIPVNLTQANSMAVNHINTKVSVPNNVGLFTYSWNLQSVPQDTFLKTTDFFKGVVLINGFNLGRYWNSKGPQYTLFVPKSVLIMGVNRVTIFELEGTNCPTKCSIEFVDQPILDGPVHFRK